MSKNKPKRRKVWVNLYPDGRHSWKSQRDEVHAEMERQTAMKLAERQEKLAVMRAHTEALDALDGIMTVVRGEEIGGAGQVADTYVTAEAVLAKAGRR